MVALFQHRQRFCESAHMRTSKTRHTHTHPSRLNTVARVVIGLVVVPQGPHSVSNLFVYVAGTVDAVRE